MAAHEDPMQKVITRCWEDEAFKARLLADPAGVLSEEGVQLPEGVTVNVAVDTDQVRTLVIPRPPARQLSDAEMTRIAAAMIIRDCGYYCEAPQ